MNISALLNALIGPVAFAILLVPAWRKPQMRGWAALVIGLDFLDSVVTRLPITFPQLWFPPHAHWNWSGKALDILVMLAVAIALIRSRNFSASDIGLTWAQKPGTARGLLFVILPFLIVLVVLTLWAFGNTEPPKTDTLLYEGTMPGLAEELFWRGLLLALFDRMFTARFTLWGAQLGYGVIATTLVFGLLHGMAFDRNMQLQLSLLGGLVPAITGFFLAWLRERSGSLVMPVLFHNATNLILESVPKIF